MPSDRFDTKPPRALSGPARAAEGAHRTPNDLPRLGAGGNGAAEPFAPIEGAPLGLYVHIPFCDRICPYCDFAVSARRRPPYEEYVTALEQELSARWEAASIARSVRTLYLGGGTPSKLPIGPLERLIAAVDRRAPIASLIEVTLEANPADVSASRARGWRALGIDRVSLGVQSFSSEGLARLGRNHDARRAERALGALLEERLEVSLDLILGGPEQGLDAWRADLARAALWIERGVHHASVYELTVEPNTPFWRARERGELALAPDEERRAMFDAAREILGAAGLEQYETSSWARPGRCARHNASYWRGAEYLGIGLGAHSLALGTPGALRRANARQLALYIKDPIGSAASVESLAAAEHAAERVVTGARTSEGIDLDGLRRQAPSLGPALERVRRRAAPLEASGLVRSGAGRVRPTPEGMLVADALANWLSAPLLERDPGPSPSAS